ncbi:MAG: glutathione peroxidase [Polyangiaceae bacterium]
MKNSEGQKVPEVTFRTREGSAWKDVTTQELFAGKTVVVFSLPGAFTPTCSSTHVPRYNELAPVFKAKGVDEIVCMSVNDGFVMQAWQVDQQAHNVRFIPDGNGEFTQGLGLLVDKRNLGFGQRSWRYSMLVKDGVIVKQFVEPQKDGDPFEVSDAETMLRYLDENVQLPHDVLMISRPGCSFCDHAKAMLQSRGIEFDEVSANPRRLKAVSGKTTTPQVFIDGEYVGGAAELETWLAQHK